MKAYHPTYDPHEGYRNGPDDRIKGEFYEQVIDKELPAERGSEIIFDQGTEPGIPFCSVE